MLLFGVSCSSRYLYLKDGRAVKCKRLTYSNIEKGYICKSDGDLFFIDESLVAEDDPVRKEPGDRIVCVSIPGVVPVETLARALSNLVDEFLSERPVAEGETIIFSFVESRKKFSPKFSFRLADAVEFMTMEKGLNTPEENVRSILMERLIFAGTSCAEGWRELGGAMFFGIDFIFCVEMDESEPELFLTVWSVAKGDIIWSGSEAL